mmetsp:Transcript_40459/g.131006  ORF Transcript_40459/g.131006 Transcript_40459/m.131006 type:complete len:244 (-) Transcript_40459:1474-2205(-)
MISQLGGSALLLVESSATQYATPANTYPQPSYTPTVAQAGQLLAECECTSGFENALAECAPNPRGVAQDSMPNANTYGSDLLSLLGDAGLGQDEVEDEGNERADGVRRLEGEKDGLAEGLEPRVELAACHPVRALVQVVDLGARLADSLQRPEAVVHLEPTAGKGGRPTALEKVWLHGDSEGDAEREGEDDAVAALDAELGEHDDARDHDVRKEERDHAAHDRVRDVGEEAADGANQTEEDEP